MSLPKMIDGRLELVDIPIAKEDGTFLLCDGMFHVDPSHPLHQPLSELFIKKPGLFQKEAPVAPYFTPERMAAAIRLTRDNMLARSDWTANGDNGLSDVKKNAYKKYRQELRNLPAQPGFPWDGGGPDTPWPSMPK